MQALFSDEQAWGAFKSELDSWIGTPHRHFQKAKKYGADCALFIGQALINIKVLNKLTYSYYPRDWHLHSETPFLEIMLFENLNKNLVAPFRYEKLETDNFCVGDLCLLSLNSKTSVDHICVYIGNEHIIHGLYNTGITVMDYNKWWQRRTKYVIRLLKE